MKNPDQLRFHGGVAGGEQLIPWTGAWPPPERLALAVGRTSGIAVAFEPDKIAEKGITLEELEKAAAVAIYLRRNASELPDSFEDANVFRGADYTPEDEQQ